MYQWHVIGAIRYLKFCPKAPGVDLCDPPQGCPGHEYPAAVDCYIDAPDERRAEHAALKKLATAYPWPAFDGVPDITVVLPPATAGATPAPRGAYLPGFAPDGAGLESVTISSGDQSVTLRRGGA